MNDGASFPTLPLPVVNLSQKAKEGFLGVGHITVRRPTQELEVTHNKLALLKLHSRKRKKLHHACFTHTTNPFRNICAYQPEAILSALRPVLLLYFSIRRLLKNTSNSVINKNVNIV